MTTPTAEAIRGLAEAVRAAAEWNGECGSCGNAIAVCDKTDQPPDPEFPGCPGPASRAALDAWEKRRPLREDAELIDAVAAKLADEFGETTRNIDPDDLAGYVRITRVLLDALDAALFGPPTKEGSRGG